MVIRTKDVAARLGIDSSRVRRLAIAHNIGTKLNDRTRVFTEGDIAMLQSVRQPTGRPSFTKTFDVAHLITQYAWIAEIDDHPVACVLRDWAGDKLADGFIAIRDGEPVVLVDDDAHTVMTATELPSQRYHVDTTMPRLPQCGEPIDDYVRHMSEFAARVGALAAAGVHTGYEQ